MTRKLSCVVRRGADGKVPEGNSLAAYPTARTVLRGRERSNPLLLPECAEHVQQLGGASPLPNLMEVKG